MRCGIVLLVLLTCMTAIAAPPSSAPATKAATKPAKSPPKQRFGLMNGAVKFMVPDGWTESDRTDAARGAQYHSHDGNAAMSVAVQPQEVPIPQRNERFRFEVEKLSIQSLTQNYVHSDVDTVYG